MASWGNSLVLICRLGSFAGADRLAVVVGRFHFEDVGDDAVNLDVADEAREEELLSHTSADQTQRGQP